MEASATGHGPEHLGLSRNDIRECLKLRYASQAVSRTIREGFHPSSVGSICRKVVDGVARVMKLVCVVRRALAPCKLDEGASCRHSPPTIRQAIHCESFCSGTSGQLQPGNAHDGHSLASKGEHYVGIERRSHGRRQGQYTVVALIDQRLGRSPCSHDSLREGLGRDRQVRSLILTPKQE